MLPMVELALVAVTHCFDFVLSATAIEHANIDLNAEILLSRLISEV